MKSMYRIGLALIPVGAALALIAQVMGSFQGHYSADPNLGLGIVLLLGIGVVVTGICLALIARHGMRSENPTTFY